MTVGPSFRLLPLLLLPPAPTLAGVGEFLLMAGVTQGTYDVDTVSNIQGAESDSR